MSDHEFAIFMALLDEHWGRPQCWRLVAQVMNALVDGGSSSSPTGKKTEKKTEYTRIVFSKIVYNAFRWLRRKKFAIFEKNIFKIFIPKK
jgi:hypothetical protein